MYLQYYGLREPPFSVTPDPAFLYLSAQHREAFGHLLHGTGEYGGFVQLTGQVGTGKTTLIRALLNNQPPELDVALCWHPQLDVLEFVATVCDELGVAYDRNGHVTLKTLIDRLNAHLLASHAKGRRTLLIVDEAQNLSRDVLEQLRLLTNLETSKHKLLRIILVGQPELDTFLARNDLRQLSQRISARFTLMSLSREETSAYIDHRLSCVGGSGHLFTPAARRSVYRYTQGTPRLVNLVCDRALMGGYAEGLSMIGPSVIRNAAHEVLPRRGRRSLMPGQRLWSAAAVAAILLLVLALAVFQPTRIGQLTAWAIAGPANNTAGTTQSVSAPDESAGYRMSDPPVAVAPGRKPEPSTTVASGADDSEPSIKPVLASGANVGLARNDMAQAEHSESQHVPPAELLPAGDAQLAQLLSLWGVSNIAIDVGCDDLHLRDLRCLSEHGTLTRLEHFNRPAILLLQYGDRRQSVLMKELDGDGATIVGAQASRRISRKSLTRLWTGSFIMVWRANGEVSYIRDNMIGEVVAWLRRRLTHAMGPSPDLEPGSQPRIFDQQLAARVQQFQQAHGLEPDGIVGPRTQIMLNNVIPIPADTPTLRPEMVEKG